MKTVLLAATLLAAAPALAHDYRVGDLVIAHPHALATVPSAPVAGGYLSVTNAGETDDVLLSAAVAPDVAGMVQLHAMEMDGGVMRMSEVDGIPVPAGETVVLERGGLHVMFMQLPAGFEAGREIPATLTFRDAGEVDVVFAVEGRGGSGSGHGDHGHGAHGG